ncbi:hypothetical protein D9V37_09695 [Nocardioides mangrovicus]|uniref:AMP-dependent synthetase/ligase domain-containing protein n=1 Tax=Nocardioides mangrovicus TaxID=2478913 RepID=A0A3L8P2S7_9ACTN|nr:hypothetical protein [Nocardioides mangrovicus]RLV48869.1 hypothetical protein D9V37_09695 [Nocardioides mangrovicus]
MSEWVNACYVLLDRPVVAGRADEPVLVEDPVSHARLLEDVAAVAGVLRAQGVGAGARAIVSADGRRGVTALLAVARLGGVVGEGVLVDEDSVGELGWDEALRLGRTDPAPVADLPPSADWDGVRTAGDLAREVAALVTPLPVASLLSVLRSSLQV